MDLILLLLTRYTDGPSGTSWVNISHGIYIEDNRLTNSGSFLSKSHSCKEKLLPEKKNPIIWSSSWKYFQLTLFFVDAVLCCSYFKHLLYNWRCSISTCSVKQSGSKGKSEKRSTFLQNVSKKQIKHLDVTANFWSLFKINLSWNIYIHLVQILHTFAGSWP